jgi:hypothetical protein
MTALKELTVQNMQIYVTLCCILDPRLESDLAYDRASL